MRIRTKTLDTIHKCTHTALMNITLSTDKKIIEKSREYAKKHNTSLNELVRNFLKKLINESDTLVLSEEFEKLALKEGGKSAKSYKFNREDIYERSTPK